MEITSKRKDVSKLVARPPISTRIRKKLPALPLEWGPKYEAVIHKRPDGWHPLPYGAGAAFDPASWTGSYTWVNVPHGTPTSIGEAILDVWEDRLDDDFEGGEI